LIPYITRKTTGKEMFDALVTLYRSENINRKMLLSNKLKATRKSTKSTIDIVVNYLMKITNSVISLQQLEKRPRVKS